MDMRNHAHSGSIAAAAAAVLVLLNVVGCGGSGDELPREAVSGTVKLDGTPVASGSISFQPNTPDVITQGGAIIQGGAYAIDVKEGLVPGVYKVAIYAGEGVLEKQSGGSRSDAPIISEAAPKELIPAKYNNKSTLTAEVEADGENVFHFDLTRK